MKVYSDMTTLLKQNKYNTAIEKAETLMDNWSIWDQAIQIYTNEGMIHKADELTKIKAKEEAQEKIDEKEWESAITIFNLAGMSEDAENTLKQMERDHKIAHSLGKEQIKMKRWVRAEKIYKEFNMMSDANNVRIIKNIEYKISVFNWDKAIELATAAEMHDYVHQIKQRKKDIYEKAITLAEQKIKEAKEETKEDKQIEKWDEAIAIYEKNKLIDKKKESVESKAKYFGEKYIVDKEWSKAIQLYSESNMNMERKATEEIRDNAQKKALEIVGIKINSLPCWLRIYTYLLGVYELNANYSKSFENSSGANMYTKLVQYGEKYKVHLYRDTNHNWLLNLEWARFSKQPFLIGYTKESFTPLDIVSNSIPLNDELIDTDLTKDYWHNLELQEQITNKELCPHQLLNIEKLTSEELQQEKKNVADNNARLKKIEEERKERERLEKERKENERKEQERIRLEEERRERERLEKERQERARLEKERQERERLERERQERIRKEEQERMRKLREKELEHKRQQQREYEAALAKVDTAYEEAKRKKEEREKQERCAAGNEFPNVLTLRNSKFNNKIHSMGEYGIMTTINGDNRSWEGVGHSKQAIPDETYRDKQCCYLPNCPYCFTYYIFQSRDRRWWVGTRTHYQIRDGGFFRTDKPGPTPLMDDACTPHQWGEWDPYSQRIVHDTLQVIKTPNQFGGGQSKKTLYNFFNKHHTLQKNGEVEIIHKDTFKINTLKQYLFFKSTTQKITTGFFMIEAIEDTKDYLLIKPYSITFNNNNHIKDCVHTCNFKSTKTLKRTLYNIFKKSNHKKYFNYKDKSIVIMYILDPQINNKVTNKVTNKVANKVANKVNLTLELVLLDHKTNTLSRLI